MSPRFFFILLALLFCLSLVQAATPVNGNLRKMINYNSIDTSMSPYAEGPNVYGRRRLLHFPETGLSHSSFPNPLSSATKSGLLIKNACQDNALDYLGNMCSLFLASAPVTSDPKSLALFALHETGKLLANISASVNVGLATKGASISPDVGDTIRLCTNTWYAEAQHKINVAIIQLHKQYNLAADAVNGASTKVRTCFLELSSKKFLQGENRLFVNEINGHNQFLKKVLAAAWSLVITANVKA